MTKLELLVSDKGLMLFLVAKALPAERKKYFDSIATKFVEIPKYELL